MKGCMTFRLNGPQVLGVIVAQSLHDAIREYLLRIRVSRKSSESR